MLGEDVVNPLYSGQDEYEEGEVLLGEDVVNPLSVGRMSMRRGRCCWVRTVSWMSWASWKIFHPAVRYPDKFINFLEIYPTKIVL